MNKISELKPRALWNNFVKLNEVPRPSKKEEKVIQFLKNFGESLNLETIVDEVGNVIIKKSATNGMENRPAVVLQGHMDMVPQKNADSDHNFEEDGIDMYIDGDWVKANGTTLGADNGIGVAATMAILESTDIPHPPIEALFTIDEETGLTGAQALKGDVLTGANLLNLDTEDDDEITIGCAGGVDVNAKGSYSQNTIGDHQGYKLTIRGLSGGHSGIQIQLGRGNANKIMNRILFKAASDFGLRVSSIDGGSLRNAIPRESFANVAVPIKNSKLFEEFINQQSDIISFEYQTTDPDFEISCKQFNDDMQVVDLDFQNRFLNVIYASPNGVYRMSPDMEGLTQTSFNLARILVKDGEYVIRGLARSAIGTEKMDFAQSIVSTFALANIEIKLTGEYPGWIPKPNAPIVKLMGDIYKDLFDEDVNISATHGGLECGIIGNNYPDMDMISFGPTITGPHSPDEQVSIPSVKKFWKYLLEVLKQI